MLFKELKINGKKGKSTTNRWYLDALKIIQQQHPWYNRSNGRDHVWPFPGARGPHIFQVSESGGRRAAEMGSPTLQTPQRPISFPGARGPHIFQVSESGGRRAAEMTTVSPQLIGHHRVGGWTRAGLEEAHQAQHLPHAGGRPVVGRAGRRCWHQPMARWRVNEVEEERLTWGREGA